LDITYNPPNATIKIAISAILYTHKNIIFYLIHILFEMMQRKFR
jgi:hypothetical protein